MTFDDAEMHLRLSLPESQAQAQLIQMLIDVATEEAERATGRALLTQTWQLSLSALRQPIELPRQPVRSIVSITYLDADGVEQTLAADQYQLSGWDDSEIIPAYGVTWPAVRGGAGCVSVRWVAGYGDNAEDIPAPIRQWILMRVATLYEHREEVVVGVPVARLPVFDGLLAPYRVFSA